MEHSKPPFLLRGFRHVSDFRVFVFERIAADRSRTSFTVRADLSLARQHRIPIQELPLLCRSILERLHEDGGPRAFVFSDAAMRQYASSVAELADAKRNKRTPLRSTNDTVGDVWLGGETG